MESFPVGSDQERHVFLELFLRFPSVISHGETLPLDQHLDLLLFPTMPHYLLYLPHILPFRVLLHILHLHLFTHFIVLLRGSLRFLHLFYISKYMTFSLLLFSLNQTDWSLLSRNIHILTKHINFKLISSFAGKRCLTADQSPCSRPSRLCCDSSCPGGSSLRIRER